MREDPEPMMQQLVRVFIGEGGTYCPGYQFLPDLTLEPVVVALFERAMELRIPHNVDAEGETYEDAKALIPEGSKAIAIRAD